MSFESPKVEEEAKRLGVAILKPDGNHAEIIADNLTAY